MQKSIIFVVALIFSTTILAQTTIENPYPRTITVTGSAEMEIVPDQIYVQITLQEYQKRGDSKKNLADIKSEFLALSRTMGIPDTAISIAGYSGDNDYFSMRRNRKKPDELFASVIYQVVFRSSTEMDALVDKLDDLATSSFTITATNHSDMINIRKKVKTLAMKAAREKAIYLAEAVGEKTGEAVSINEGYSTDGFYSYANQFSNNTYVQYEPSQPTDFRKLKIRYEITATYALKY